MAEIVKAVAQQQGWNHHAHNYLTHAAVFVMYCLGRTDLLSIFDQVGGSHSNYYEHQAMRDEVEIHLANARILIDFMDGVLSNPDLQLVPDSPQQESRLRSLTRKTAFSHGPEFTTEDAAELPPVVP